MTDEIVDVALKWASAGPRPSEQLIGGRDGAPAAAKLLDDMSWLGIIQYNWENLDGKNPPTRSAISCLCSCPAAPSS